MIKEIHEQPQRAAPARRRAPRRRPAAGRPIMQAPARSTSSAAARPRTPRAAASTCSRASPAGRPTASSARSSATWRISSTSAPGVGAQPERRDDRRDRLGEGAPGSAARSWRRSSTSRARRCTAWSTTPSCSGPGRSAACWRPRALPPSWRVLLMAAYAAHGRVDEGRALVERAADEIEAFSQRRRATTAVRDRRAVRRRASTCT